MKKWADRFLRWFCNPDYYADIRGDLEELYYYKLQDSSKFTAGLYFTKEVLLLLRLSLLRPSLFKNPLTYTDMTRNNLKIAFRHLWRQKVYASIKIGGLALGIAAFILLAIYLKHELSYDNFYPQTDRIYRVTTQYLKEGFSGVDFPGPFAKALENDFPEVEKAGRYIPATWFNQVRPADQVHNTYEEGIAYVDPELLEILEIPMIHGEYESSMHEPNTLIISQSKAHKYFPNKNPVNQSLILNGNAENPYKIVGVYQDFPTNAHLDFEFMISLEGVEFWEGEQSYWGNNMYDVYALLKEGTNVEQLNPKLSSIITQYFLPLWRERQFANADEIAASMSFRLQPIDEIYMQNEEVRDGLPHGDQRLFWLLGISGILIIVIASINFINLSIARYSLRVKEVGMRKLLGAAKKQIVQQFLTESVLYSFFAILLGVVLALLLLPNVSQLAGKTLTFPWKITTMIPLFILSILFLGILTGIYPSLFLSAFRPSSSSNPIKLKGSRHKRFQQGLVIFQFAVSIALIMVTLTVYQQMNFILKKDVGFDKEQLMMIQGTQALGEKVPIFKEELLTLSEVEQVSVSGFLPVEGSFRNMDSFWKEGEQTLYDGTNAQIWYVDEDYLATLGMRLIEGRNFSKRISTDSNAIILSRSLAEKLALKEPLGAQITNKRDTWQVVGIIDDFHFESLKAPVSPTCLVMGNNTSMISVKVNTSEMSPLLSSIEEIWDTFAPENQFRYEFLDESFAHMHKEVSRSAQLFNVFAVLAIVIACLGLFGLTTFHAEQRQREIGIRKVLGASVGNIVSLLSKDFVKLFGIAVLIALPLGWYVANNWLESFAYRIPIYWWICLLAVGITFCIALFTTSFKSLAAAFANPIESIRVDS